MPTVEACAAMCWANEDCQFFLHDPRDGECLVERTSSAQCPEGLVESPYYNFYANMARGEGGNYQTQLILEG